MKAQERQLSMVACLLNHRYGRTLDQLIRDIPDYGEGDAARKKFQRDRKLLEEMGVLIRMEVLEGEDATGNLQYVYRLDRRELFARPLDLSEEEVRALAWLAQQLEAETNWPFREMARSALEKLKAEREPGARLSERVRILAYSALREDRDLLEALGKAVVDGVSCEVRYRSANGEERTRTIHPYRLKFNHGHWYCLAWCEWRQAAREFRVSRMSEFRPGSTPFERRAEVDLEGWSRDDSWELGLGEGQTVEVVFEKGLSRLVRRRLGRQAVFHEEDSLRVQLDVARPGAFLEWLLSWGARARLVGPPSMRQLLREKLQRARALYSDGGSH
ncbi:MAG: WYL domain-containing protein [Candidatus Cloacimonetes bacterium]|nr:WYL domain-containing protein [Candidatus Cloacimonadota bacterium]